jgi:hypothetical protein
VAKAVSKLKMSICIIVTIITASALYVRVENFEKFYFANHEYLGMKRACYKTIYDLFKIGSNTESDKISRYCLGYDVYSTKFANKFDELIVYRVSMRELEDVAQKCDVNPALIQDLGGIFTAEIVSQSINKNCIAFKIKFGLLYSDFKSKSFTLRDVKFVTNETILSISLNQKYNESGTFIGYSSKSGRIACILSDEIYSEYDSEILRDKIATAFEKCIKEFSKI